MLDIFTFMMLAFKIPVLMHCSSFGHHYSVLSKYKEMLFQETHFYCILISKVVNSPCIVVTQRSQWSPNIVKLKKNPTSFNKLFQNEKLQYSWTLLHTFIINVCRCDQRKETSCCNFRRFIFCWYQARALDLWHFIMYVCVWQEWFWMFSQSVSDMAGIDLRV